MRQSEPQDQDPDPHTDLGGFWIKIFLEMLDPDTYLCKYGSATLVYTQRDQ